MMIIEVLQGLHELLIHDDLVLQRQQQKLAWDVPQWRQQQLVQMQSSWLPGQLDELFILCKGYSQFFKFQMQTDLIYFKIVSTL